MPRRLQATASPIADATPLNDGRQRGAILSGHFFPVQVAQQQGDSRDLVRRLLNQHDPLSPCPDRGQMRRIAGSWEFHGVEALTERSIPLAHSPSFGGQGVRREAESEGYTGKYRAVVEGATPRQTTCGPLPLEIPSTGDYSS